MLTVEYRNKLPFFISQLFLTPRHPSKNMLNLQKSKENNGTYGYQALDYADMGRNVKVNLRYEF